MLYLSPSEKDTIVEMYLRQCSVGSIRRAFALHSDSAIYRTLAARRIPLRPPARDAVHTSARHGHRRAEAGMYEVTFVGNLTVTADTIQSAVEYARAYGEPIEVRAVETPS